MRLAKKLTGAACIHGDLQQNARDRVMAQFREGKVRYLVATDVVGRGIDVTGISHIINYDIPQFCDDYVHRVGRTGRMGREGVAYTFVTPEEGNELTRIEMRIDRLLKRDEMPGFEATSRPNRSATAAALPNSRDTYDESDLLGRPAGRTCETASRPAIARPRRPSPPPQPPGTVNAAEPRCRERPPWRSVIVQMASASNVGVHASACCRRHAEA